METMEEIFPPVSRLYISYLFIWIENTHKYSSPSHKGNRVACLRVRIFIIFNNQHWNGEHNQEKNTIIRYQNFLKIYVSML